jgi:hypothetical protein
MKNMYSICTVDMQILSERIIYDLVRFAYLVSVHILRSVYAASAWMKTAFICSSDLSRCVCCCYPQVRTCQ